MSDKGANDYGYRIVEFVGETNGDGMKTIEVVLTQWIQEKSDSTMNDFCFYPPKKDWIKVPKWVEEERPYKNSWGLYEVEILGKAGTLEKAQKKLEKLYKSRSEQETDSELDSVHSELSLTKKRAANVLQTSHSLEAIEEELIVHTPKRSRKASNHQTDGILTSSPSTSRDTGLFSPVGGTINAQKKVPPKVLLQESLQKLRQKNQDDAVKMFYADYLDASLALLSYDYKLESHNLRRCHQLDMTNHTKELKISINTPMLPLGEKFVLVESKLGMKIPVNTLEDFEKWEKMLDLIDAENVEEVTQRRAALMEFMNNETSGSTDFVADIKKILPLFINKPVQLLYSGVGRKTRGVAKKNFSSTMSYECMRDFLKAKYKKSEKDMQMISTTSDWLANAPDRAGGAAERKRAQHSI